MQKRATQFGLLLVCVGLTDCAATARAQSQAAPPAGRAVLPQDHPYQRELRQYLAAATCRTVLVDLLGGGALQYKLAPFGGQDSP